MNQSKKCSICFNIITYGGGNLLDISLYSDKTLNDVIESVLGYPQKFETSSTCDRCTELLNYHEEFATKTKLIQNELKSLVKLKHPHIQVKLKNLKSNELSNYDEDLSCKIETIESSSDDDDDDDADEIFYCPESDSDSNFNNKNESKLEQQIDSESNFSADFHQFFSSDSEFELEEEIKTPKKRAKTEKNESNSSLICVTCGREFKTNCAVKTHMKYCDRQTELMNEKGQIKCDYEGCSKVFNDFRIYNTHQRYHRYIRVRTRVCCTLCGKLFVPGYKMNRHLETHNLDKINTCPLCPSRFKESDNLKTHFKQYHRELIEVEPKQLRIIKYFCSICPEKYKEVEKLKEHMQQSHNIYQPIVKKNMNKNSFIRAKKEMKERKPRKSRKKIQ